MNINQLGELITPKLKQGLLDLGMELLEFSSHMGEEDGVKHEVLYVWYRCPHRQGEMRWPCKEEEGYYTEARADEILAGLLWWARKWCTGHDLDGCLCGLVSFKPLGAISTH